MSVYDKIMKGLQEAIQYNKRENKMTRNKIIFMGVDIPKQIKAMREQIEKDQINPFDEKSWNAGVNYIMDILQMICDDDGEHVIVHIPNQKIGTELFYDDLKKLDFCKYCKTDVEM